MHANEAEKFIILPQRLVVMVRGPGVAGCLASFVFRSVGGLGSAGAAWVYAKLLTRCKKTKAPIISRRRKFACFVQQTTR